MGTVAFARRESAAPWVILGLVAAVLLVWWWSLIERGPLSPAQFLPFALPALLIARALVRGSFGPALTGLALACVLLPATGRGVVFTLVALAAVLIELVGAQAKGRAALVGAAGFVVGLGVIAVLLTSP